MKQWKKSRSEYISVYLVICLATFEESSHLKISFSSFLGESFHVERDLFIQYFSLKYPETRNQQPATSNIPS